MPARVTVKVEGFRAMEKALFQLKHTTARNVVRRAAKTALEPVKTKARATVDRRSGKLHDSIEVSTRAKPRGAKKSKIEVYVGPGRLVQAITEEFGTFNQAPDPFLRPAWDAEKFNVLTKFSESMSTNIDKAVARAARKAEREARKMKRGG